MVSTSNTPNRTCNTGGSEVDGECEDADERGQVVDMMDPYSALQASAGDGGGSDNDEAVDGSEGKAKTPVRVSAAGETAGGGMEQLMEKRLAETETISDSERGNDRGSDRERDRARGRGGGNESDAADLDETESTVLDETDASSMIHMELEDLDDITSMTSTGDGSENPDVNPEWVTAGNAGNAGNVGNVGNAGGRGVGGPGSERVAEAHARIHAARVLCDAAAAEDTKETERDAGAGGGAEGGAESAESSVCEAEYTGDVVAYAKRLFEEADHNNDGWLTKKEIKKYFLAHPEQRQQILGDHFTWHAFFTEMDTDHNGKFDVGEWVDSVTAAVSEGASGPISFG